MTRRPRQTNLHVLLRPCGERRPYYILLSIFSLLVAVVVKATASESSTSSWRGICAGVLSRCRRREQQQSNIRGMIRQSRSSSLHPPWHHAHQRGDESHEKVVEVRNVVSAVWSRRGEGWIRRAPFLLPFTSILMTVANCTAVDESGRAVGVLVSSSSVMWAPPLRGGTGTVLRLAPKTLDGHRLCRGRQSPTKWRQRQLLLETTLALRGGENYGGGGSGEGEGVEDAGEGDALSTTSISSMLSRIVSGDDAKNHTQYTLLSDKVVFRGWRNVIERQVQYPSGNIVKFHLTCQSGPSNCAVLIFSWDRSSKTCTLIREYMPSRHSMVIGLAAGMVEKSTRLSSGSDENRSAAMDSAQRELAEEYQLEGGTWYALTPSNGVVMDKYCTTALHAFLVVDAKPLSGSSSSFHRDEAEEGMTVVSGVSAKELRQCIQRGELTVVGTWGALLAMEKLRNLREIA